MNIDEFYRIYIPALEKAFNEDNNNYGFYVKGPEDFIPEEHLTEIENFISKEENLFLESIAYYFDAKSHYFNVIDQMPIEIYKMKLQEQLNGIKNLYGINS